MRRAWVRRTPARTVLARPPAAAADSWDTNPYEPSGPPTPVRRTGLIQEEQE
ncbi:hypothetical protein AB0C86_05710 [Streptomyces lavendulae]|uniref:hypothetical protein n=1 Tax=Streptomyces lavendulae TaxID=1914 RepID=UPI0025552603|nr:hypothetical protein [Streptomyces lavendulae]